MKKIKLDAHIYDKDCILYVLNLYDEIDFDIIFKDNTYYIKIKNNISTDEIKELKNEIDSVQLRKDIANSNKKIREYIIATALGFPEK